MAAKTFSFSVHLRLRSSEMWLVSRGLLKDRLDASCTGVRAGKIETWQHSNMGDDLFNFLFT